MLYGRWMREGSVLLHVSLYVGSRNDFLMEANFASNNRPTKLKSIIVYLNCVFLKVILIVKVNGIVDDLESLQSCLAWNCFLGLQYIFPGKPNAPKNSTLAV
jgi:hypothetical protein